MLHEVDREEPVGPHDHIFSQCPANQVGSQSFPRISKVPATNLTNKRLTNLETVVNKMQKDMWQYFKSHRGVESCSSCESLSSLPSQQPEDCCEDLNNLSPGESYSDFEDYMETMMNYQSNPADSHPQTLSDAKYLSLKIGRRGNPNLSCNTIFNYKFNSLPGKFVLSK